MNNFKNVYSLNNRLKVIHTAILHIINHKINLTLLIGLIICLVFLFFFLFFVESTLLLFIGRNVVKIHTYMHINNKDKLLTIWLSYSFNFHCSLAYVWWLPLITIRCFGFSVLIFTHLPIYQCNGISFNALTSAVRKLCSPYYESWTIHCLKIIIHFHCL